MRYQQHHGVIVSDAVLGLIVKLAKQHFPERRLPDSAIDLLDESCSYLCMSLSNGDTKMVAMLQNKIAATMKQIQRLEQTGATTVWGNPTAGQLGGFAWPGVAGRGVTRPGPAGSLAANPGQSDQAKAADLRFGAIPKLQQQLKAFASRASLTEAHVKQVLSSRKRVAIVDGVESKEAKAASGLLKGERDSASVLGLEQRLNQHVVGQPVATKAVATSIMRSQTGLADKRRPIACLMFLGPSGVGKTQLAKRLAVELFGRDNDMVRIDGSEYREMHSVARLIGSPPGYVGSDDGGQLTNAVRKTPHSIVLVDEIEKAHPNVLNVFLQVMDDARLTDAKGRTVSFKDCVIIMTSNVGSELIVGSPDDHDVVMALVRRSFRPELLNRFDNIVVFNQLGQEQLRAIVRLQVKDVADRLGQISKPEITLTVTDGAADIMVAVSTDKDFGARALRRYLERAIVDPLAELLLKKELHPGATVLVDAVDDQLMLKAENPKASMAKSRSETKRADVEEKEQPAAKAGPDSGGRFDGDLGPPPEDLRPMRVGPWGQLAYYSSDAWPADRA